MSLLLDTHVALWGLSASPELGEELLDRLRHDPDIYLSPVTVWEIAIKQALGKLPGPADLAERVRDMGFRELPINSAHAVVAGRLPMHHRDPFDRMLVAQATVEGLTLATRDPFIHRYDVKTLPVQPNINLTRALFGYPLAVSAGVQRAAASLRTTYWFRLIPSSAACVASQRCKLSPTRTLNLPE